MKVIVRKRMMAGDTQLESGDIVDASQWRQLKNLLAVRYVEPYIEEVKPTVKAKAVEEAKPVEEVKPKKTTKKETVEE